MAQTLRLCKVFYEAGGKKMSAVIRNVSAVKVANSTVIVYYYVLLFKQGTIKTLKVVELKFHAS
jgi:hypothetical protein